jgi:hypothetical protein
VILLGFSPIVIRLEYGKSFSDVQLLRAFWQNPEGVEQLSLLAI